MSRKWAAEDVARETECAAREAALRVVELWNAERSNIVVTTTRCAIVVGTPWMDIYCPGCRTWARAILGYLTVRSWAISRRLSACASWPFPPALCLCVVLAVFYWRYPSPHWTCPVLLMSSSSSRVSAGLPFVLNALPSCAGAWPSQRGVLLGPPLW